MNEACDFVDREILMKKLRDKGLSLPISVATANKKIKSWKALYADHLISRQFLDEKIEEINRITLDHETMIMFRAAIEEDSL